MNDLIATLYRVRYSYIPIVSSLPDITAALNATETEPPVTDKIAPTATETPVTDKIAPNMLVMNRQTVYALRRLGASDFILTREGEVYTALGLPVAIDEWLADGDIRPAYRG